MPGDGYRFEILAYQHVRQCKRRRGQWRHNFSFNIPSRSSVGRQEAQISYRTNWCETQKERPQTSQKEQIMFLRETPVSGIVRRRGLWGGHADTLWPTPVSGIMRRVGAYEVVMLTHCGLSGIVAYLVLRCGGAYEMVMLTPCGLPLYLVLWVEEAHMRWSCWRIVA